MFSVSQGGGKEGCQGRGGRRGGDGAGREVKSRGAQDRGIGDHGVTDECEWNRASLVFGAIGW